MKKNNKANIIDPKRLIFNRCWLDGEPLWDTGRDDVKLDYKQNTHKRANHRDNKLIYNTKALWGAAKHRVRIPSLKRNDYTWKHFYRLFPMYYIAMRGIVSSLIDKNDIRLLKKMYIPEFEKELRIHPHYKGYFVE